MSKANEIISTRNVPYTQRDVYEAWTNPELLASWWGPKGFTNTFHEFNLRPGGEWRFTMHSPAGDNYENKCIFRKIVESELLVFDHVEPVHAFTVTVSFSKTNQGTAVTFLMDFISAEECSRSQAIIEPSNEENFDRLESVLASHFTKIDLLH